MDTVAGNIPGYDYGGSKIADGGLSEQEFQRLKTSAGFTAEDAKYLQMAGTVLVGQTQVIVHLWRSNLIAKIPHLARHSRALEGLPLPEYLSKSNRRFEQWIVDTCTKPYDQHWVNYQLEIARRHTPSGKNQTDGVVSTPFVPFRDIIAFIAVMNETIKPYLGSHGHSEAEIECMHKAWCKSIQLQLALWAKVYMSGPDAMALW